MHDTHGGVPACELGGFSLEIFCWESLYFLSSPKLPRPPFPTIPCALSAMTMSPLRVRFGTMEFWTLENDVVILVEDMSINVNYATLFFHAVFNFILVNHGFMRV